MSAENLPTAKHRTQNTDVQSFYFYKCKTMSMRQWFSFSYTCVCDMCVDVTADMDNRLQTTSPVRAQIFNSQINNAREQSEFSRNYRTHHTLHYTDGN